LNNYYAFANGQLNGNIAGAKWEVPDNDSFEFIPVLKKEVGVFGIQHLRHSGIPWLRIFECDLLLWSPQ